MMRSLLFAAVLGALLALSSPALAAPAAGKLTLQSVAAIGQRQPTVQLTARLLGPDGKPVGSQSIEFFVKSDDFGGVQVSLGTVPTDTGGQAKLLYMPRWTGTLAFTAHLIGDGTLAAPPATSSYLAAAAVPAYHMAPAPLSALRFGVAWAVEALAVAVWVMLAAVLIRVVRGLPRLARETEASSHIEGVSG